MDFRDLSLRSDTLDETSRTIQAQIATEAPVPMYDWTRGEMVPEVLRADGVIVPHSGQIPLLESHQRWSTESMLGSARGIKTNADGPFGTLHFDESAQRQWGLVRNGHLKDVSAGYRVLEKTYVPRDTTQIVGGRSYTGPVNVVTKWALREVSVTPIGADAQAKMRGLDWPPPEQEKYRMDPELKKLLVSLGLRADASDEEAQKWLLENRSSVFAQPKPDEKKPTEERKVGTDGAAGDGTRLDPAVLQEAVRKALKEQEEQRTALRNEIRSLCELADVPEFAERAEKFDTVEAARAAILEEKKKHTAEIGVVPSIRVSGEGRDRFREDIGAAMTLRCLDHLNPSENTRKRFMPDEKKAQAAQRWQYATILEIAGECLRADGIDTRGLPRQLIAQAALVGPEAARLEVRSGYGAYHTTGSFPALVVDAINKSLMIGYTEYPATWRGPMRQAPSVPDFKQIHRIRLGSIPNLSAWPSNTDPQKASFADAQEVYAVEAFSLEIDYDWKLLVNEDMDALSRTPAQMGIACSRTVNANAWAQWTSNPTMADGVALFSAATGNRKRPNLLTGAAVPSNTTLQLMKQQLMQMHGENTPEQGESAAILGLVPRYISGPSTLATTIEQLVLSVNDPNAAITGVYNPSQRLVPVIEPLLDSSSTTAWYLSADTSQVDTVEVTFLQGQEQPWVRNWTDVRKLSQSYAVVQTFGAKAMNHRGVQKHAGA